MRIYVHSSKRAGLKIGTLSWLQPVWPMVTIACPAREVPHYRAHWPTLDIAPLEDGLDLPHAMHTIVHTMAMDKRIIMMDDDLRFAYRAGPGTNLSQCFNDNLVQMVADLDFALAYNAHATLSPRQGNNQHEDAFSYVGGARSVLGLRVDICRTAGIRFDRVPSKADYDGTLQLLRKGYRNKILWRYSHDQVGGPTLPGGCTETRTAEIHALASNTLYTLHPEFVKVVIKEKPEWTNTGGKRHDVVVSWKKAYQSATPANPPILIRRFK